MSPFDRADYQVILADLSGSRDHPGYHTGYSVSLTRADSPTFPLTSLSNVRTTLGGGTSIAQGLFIEMFLTALLVISIAKSSFRVKY